MKDWEILMKEGRFVGGGYLGAKIWKIEPDKYPRRGYSVEDLKIGFAVGSKVHKSAVKRNKIKRQLREVVRLLLKEKKLKNGYIVAFLPNASIVGKTYEDIKRAVLIIFKKSRLLI